MMNRRDFLKTGATLVGVSALIPPVFHKALLLRQGHSLRGGPDDDARVMVVVQMAGGNDGLNTVVPITDSLYYDARPGLSIAQSEALSLDRQTGLHPVMGKFKELWDQGIVAVVEGVGYPNQNFSHFASMDIWQTADPSLKMDDGWLGRYYEKHQGDSKAPFLGLAVGGILPTSFVTPAVSVPSVPSVAGYQFQKDPQGQSIADRRFRALLSLYQDRTPETKYARLLYETVQSSVSSITLLQEANARYKTSVPYPNDSLSASLKLVAATIAADIGVKIYHVAIGGFDTHANQLEDHPRQLTLFSGALNAFSTDLKAKGLDSKVLIMTWSEFGRRVKGNASQGSDHGSAAPLFFIGTPVKGGFYGERPSLSNLDNGNLRYTIDFRSVYATVLESWLGVPTKEILGAPFETIPLFR